MLTNVLPSGRILGPIPEPNFHLTTWRHPGHVTLTATFPPHGLNFVDLPSRTVVHQDAGTLLIFQPRRMHGTTVGHRLAQHGVTTTSSERIVQAMRDAGGKVVRLDEPILYTTDMGPEVSLEDILTI